MAIYRGPGGAGDATADTTSTSALASSYATAAAASASAAATSASSAATSATEAGTYAASAAGAATSAANAASSASAAATSASNAATSEANAATSETNAVASADLANDWATKTSGTVAGGEYSAKYHAQAASTSASNASTSASNAATSASNAATSATSALNASASAAISETNAAASESAAATSETNAASSASTASTAATNASNSASSASTSATNASNSASAAATSATNAANSASAAATSETNAASSASTASTASTTASSAATAAQAAQTAAEAAYDSFDDRYLGAKSSAPTLDNDGNALVTGALYYNTTVPQLYIWNGTAWDNAAFNASGAVTSFNTRTGAVTLSSGDVTGALTYTPLAPSDIGSTIQAYDADLGAIAALAGTSGLLKKTAANTWSLDTSSYLTTETDPVFVASPSYSITNTQVSNWDTAYGWGNHASAGYLTSSAIGTTVQAYDSDLTSWAGKTAPTGDAVGTSDTQTLTNKTLTDPAITGTILEDIYTITDGAAFEIDPGNGSIQLITLGASRTPKATNFANGESVTLMVDDGTAYTITWTNSTFGGSGVVWKTNAGVAPTLNTSGYTVITLWKVGGQVYGARVGDA